MVMMGEEPRTIALLDSPAAPPPVHRKEVFIHLGTFAYVLNAS